MQKKPFKNIIGLGIDELISWSGWIDTLISQNKWEKGYLIGKKAKKALSKRSRFRFQNCIMLSKSW